MVRIGAGPQAPATALVPPDTKPLEQLEPLSALALRRFVRAHAAVPGLPLAMPLTGFARVHVQGDRGRAAALRADPGQVNDALEAGGERCRAIARETMAEVREAVGLR